MDENRRTGLLMALNGIFEPGFSPSKVAEYREELYWAGPGCEDDDRD